MELSRSFSSSSTEMSDCYISDDSPVRSPRGDLRKETIFCNRSLDMDEISCFGFDMDYTLAEYLSPAMDQLGHSLAKQHLVTECGHLPGLLELEYEEVVRGAWLDREAGNLLTVDTLGHILHARHGKKVLTSEKIRELYPNGRVKEDSKRIFVMNTMFNLAETCLLSQTLDLYENYPGAEVTRTGVTVSGKMMTFENIFKDIRAAIDDIHVTSLKLKTTVLADPAKYIKSDSRMRAMLQKLRSADKKTFLLTNSDWWYTNAVMTFLLGDCWTSYFNLVVVDGCKPRFFSMDHEMTQMKPVQETKTPVFSGGTKEGIQQLIDVSGHKVIYFGDHLPADIVECRLRSDWRTCLIVPEMRETHADQTSDDNDILNLKKKLKHAAGEASEGISVFRCGKSLTQFGVSLSQFADLYTGSVNNLLEYEVDHKFVGGNTFLRHE